MTRGCTPFRRPPFTYFWQTTNPENGLIPDNTMAATPASIAGVGMALATCVVGAERGFVTRPQALERTLRTLRFLWKSAQSTEGDATGYRGFFYHFLDVRTGARASGVRAVDDGHGDPAGRRPDGWCLLRSRRGRGAGGTRAGGAALLARRLALGPERRRNRHKRLDTRAWIHSVPMARLQRSTAALCAWSGLSHARVAGRELSRVDVHVPMETLYGREFL